MRSNILKLLITLNHQSLSFKTIRTSNTPFTYWNNQLKPLNEYSKLSIFQLCFMQNSCPDAYAIVPIMPTASAKLCLVVTGEKGWASQQASQPSSKQARQPATAIQQANQPASQPSSKQASESWRPVGRLKEGVWRGGRPHRKKNLHSLSWGGCRPPRPPL